VLRDGPIRFAQRRREAGTCHGKTQRQNQHSGFPICSYKAEKSGFLVFSEPADFSCAKEAKENEQRPQRFSERMFTIDHGERGPDLDLPFPPG
jgi:hypothetical protein